MQSFSSLTNLLLNYLPVCVLLSLFWQNLLQAQIVPDSTLPSNSRLETECTICTIEGGTVRGDNLFHSFEEFSVLNGGQAFFNNAAQIRNIISRVTGKSVSSIDGEIRANGGANFFLINPNGIIFGPDASLNIGGSFVGSTAESINFADNTQFSAVDPPQSLLTINVPVGLNLGVDSRPILVRGIGHNLVNSGNSLIFDRSTISTGLRVSPGNTLALVGGNIILEGGLLTAEAGHVELSSVGSGLVKFSSFNQGSKAVPINFEYQDVTSFQDILLSSRALIDASDAGNDTGGGSIHLQGANLNVFEGSFILIQNQGTQEGGDIRLDASETIEVSGRVPDSLSDSFFSSKLTNQNIGSVEGGDIILSSRHLLVRNGGFVADRVLGSGEGGSVVVNAVDSVQIGGSSPFDPEEPSFLNTTTEAAGNAGNISITTKQLEVFNGGAILSASFFNSTGDSGIVRVNASESISIVGAQSSEVTSSVVGSASGSAGDAKSVILDTQQLVVRDGGRIDSSALATGDAGSIRINASSVNVSGTTPRDETPSLIISSANIANQRLQEIFGLPPEPTGNSGDVAINTERLTVADKAQVTVRNDGAGNAGSLRINADLVFLSEQGGVSASTNSGNGGNILIDTNTLVGVGNSDITANANDGMGGFIQINAQGIVGLESREQLTNESDITAFSARDPELGGIVEINAPEAEPNEERAELPQEVIDVASIIDQNLCASKDGGSEFSVTGRGGLPESPSSMFSPDDTWEDWRIVENNEASTIEPPSEPVQPSLSQPQETEERIIEAQGWVRNANGSVILTAQSNVTIPQGIALPQGCQHLAGQRQEKISVVNN